MTKRLIYSFAATLLAAASLYAEPPIKAQIPFSFHVGNSTFPAGSYTTNTNVASGTVLVLKSADGKSSAMVLITGMQSAGGPTQPTLVFHKYGDEFFLSQVWSGNGGAGHQLVKTRHEAELEAAAKRSIQTVVASR